MSDEVLTLPRKWLDQFDTFMPWSSASALTAGLEEDVKWLPRSRAERSSTRVQAISCALLRDEEGRLCVFRRIRDTRADLAERITLVVGGHVDFKEESPNLSDILVNTLQRELREELLFGWTSSPRPIGMVLDWTDQESSRHVAFVFEICVKGRVKTTAAEEFSLRSRLSGKFFQTSELTRFHKHFDPWSKILFERYLGGGPSQEKFKFPP